MKRKILSGICFALILTLLLPVLSVAAAEQKTTVIGGQTFRIISTAEEFEAMNGSNNYILSSDIDFGGKVYDRYAVKALFHGILDGNGHSLLNFSVSSTESGAGIFNMAYRTDADGTVLTDPSGGAPLAANGYTFTVRNLTVGSEAKPIAVSSTQNQVGTLSGYIADSNVVHISNVRIYANLSTDGQQIGGFFGRSMTNRQNEGSSFTDCEFHGTVSGKASNVAGFIGYSAFPIEFRNCVNYGNITSQNTNAAGFIGVNYSAKYCRLVFGNCRNEGTVKGLNCIGGFVGKGQYTVEMTDCVNAGEILASGTHVGGLVAYEFNPTDYLTNVVVRLENCENTARVSTESLTGNIGGLVGTVNDSAVIVRCRNSGEVVNGKYAGGIVGLFAPQKTSDTYKKNEVFSVEITDTVNNGPVTMKAASSGSCAGILGGTTWNGIHSEVLVESCANNAAVTDISTAEVSSRVAGIVGRFDHSTGVLVIQNCLNAGTVTGTEWDTVSGLLGYTNASVNGAKAEDVPEGTRPVIRRIENCLSIGTLLKGQASAGTNAIGHNYVAGSGTLVNCYALADCAELAAFGETEALSVTSGQLASGEVSYLLGEAFGQKIGTDSVPSVGGNPVLKRNELYYNKIHTHDFTGSDYTSLNAGSHVRVCRICGEKVSEAHQFGDYIDNGDGTHYRVCEKCGYRSVSHKHSFTYTDNGDGTHTGVCSSCGAVITEEHQFEDGTCSLCGAGKPASQPPSETEPAPTEPSHNKGIYLAIGDHILIPLWGVIAGGVAIVLIAATAITVPIVMKKRRK